jgi:16S rRNA (uracil1498-N3)-methyltransferase
MRVLLRTSAAGIPWVVGNRLSLDDDEVQHLKVRRAKDGDKVELLDGSGLLGRGVLVQLGREWLVEVRASEVQPRPAPLTLAVAAGDRDRFSWMVEKAVELGVTRIVPLESNRTAGVATRLKDSHVARLRRSALEGTKQCGAAWAPAIENPVSLADFMGDPLSGRGWLADQDGIPAPASLDRDPVTVVVGPEGGLTAEERKAAALRGYQPTALGIHTLRFETAALAAAAAVTQARMRGPNG